MMNKKNKNEYGWTYPCQNHSDRNGWIDVGTEEEPIYLCKECYLRPVVKEYYVDEDL